MNALEYLVSVTLDPVRDYIRKNESIVNYHQGRNADQQSYKEAITFYLDSWIHNHNLIVEKVTRAKSYEADMTSCVGGGWPITESDCIAKIEELERKTIQESTDALSARVGNDQYNGEYDADLRVSTFALAWVKTPEILPVLVNVLCYQGQGQAQDVKPLKSIIIRLMTELFQTMVDCCLDKAKGAEADKISYARKLPTAPNADSFISILINAINLLDEVNTSNPDPLIKIQKLVANITSLRAETEGFHNQVKGYTKNNQFVVDFLTKVEGFLTEATTLRDQKLAKPVPTI